MRAVLAFAWLMAFLSSCAETPRPATTVEPEGKLKVLDFVPGLLSQGLPENWVAEGPDDVIKTQVAFTEKNGVRSIKVTNSTDNFVVARRTKAIILATPYLTWAWNMAPHGSGYHPVRIVVGFKGGAKNGASALPQIGSALPPHDRALAINWADTALKRGALTKPSRGGRVAPIYTIRGGRENANTWWLEAVDLSRLYKRIWPKDNLGAVEVVYIGVAAAGGREPTAAYISEIKLSR